MSFDDAKQVLGVVRDVTERDRALEELQKREKALRALFDYAPNAILVHALDGRVLEANPAAGALFECLPEELVGRDLSDLVPETESKSARVNLARLAEGDLEDFEGTCLTASGSSIPVSVSANRFRQGDELRILVHVADLTKRRKLESQLLQSQKMEAIGRLAGGIAHDFNNLLTAILGYSELVLAEVGTSHAASEDLGEIHKAAERAAKLTQQLLAFSRQQVLQPEVVDLNEIVLDIEKLCRRTLGENIKLVLKLDPNLGRARIDQGQLGQVLLNLAINARDAMPGGGELRLETKNVDPNETHELREASVPPGSYVALTVTDTGSGMSEEVRSQIFDPFFSTKSADKGTGLGLSTVYGIVKQSGGYIWVRSEVGAGSTFEIRLPLVDREARVLEGRRRLGAAPAVGKTVLVVDDEATLLKLATRTLEDRGYVVISESTGEDASARARDHRGVIDLLVTDFALPGINGLQLAREVRLGMPDLRVVLMTGYSRLGSLRKAEGLEGVHLLQKPFVRRTLLEAVEAALASPARDVGSDLGFGVEPGTRGDIST